MRRGPVAAPVGGGARLPGEVHLLPPDVRAGRAARLAAGARQDAGGEEDAPQSGRARASPRISSRKAVIRRGPCALLAAGRKIAARRLRGALAPLNATPRFR